METPRVASRKARPLPGPPPQTGERTGSHSSRQAADVRLRIVLGLSAAFLVVCASARARADETPDSSPSTRPQSSIYPRWTPLEIQTPGVVAGSGGLWLLVPGGVHHRIGFASDVGFSLAGTTLAVGPGILQPEFEDGSLSHHENGWSVAAQGLICRTWPWWTPRLPSSTTYVGTDITAGYVMYRGWLGAMRAVGDRETADWKLVGGIGIGLP